MYYTQTSHRALGLHRIDCVCQCMARYKIVMQRLAFVVCHEIQHYTIIDDICFLLYLSSTMTLENLLWACVYHPQYRDHILVMQLF